MLWMMQEVGLLSVSYNLQMQLSCSLVFVAVYNGDVGYNTKTHICEFDRTLASL